MEKAEGGNAERRGPAHKGCLNSGWLNRTKGIVNVFWKRKLFKSPAFTSHVNEYLGLQITEVGTHLSPKGRTARAFPIRYLPLQIKSMPFLELSWSRKQSFCLKNSGVGSFIFQNWEMNPGLSTLNSIPPYFSVTRSHKLHIHNIPEEVSQMAGIVNIYNYTSFTISFKTT